MLPVPLEVPARLGGPAMTRAAVARAALFAAGVAPIGSLCLALFGWLPLPLGARWLFLPAIFVALAAGLASPHWGRRALAGFLAGLAATAAYDVTRLALVGLGVWPDFIPPIGRLALEDPTAHPLWGYLWRFIGNGGGLGIAFAMLPWRGVRAGMVYGTVICLCLFATLLLAPGAQATLFPLTPLTALAGLVGHLDYGGVLGYLLRRATAERPARAERAAGA